MEELKPGFYRIFGKELVPPANKNNLSMELHLTDRWQNKFAFLFFFHTFETGVHSSGRVHTVGINHCCLRVYRGYITWLPSGNHLGKRLGNETTDKHGRSRQMLKLRTVIEYSKTMK